jgi:hypothetical protein
MPIYFKACGIREAAVTALSGNIRYQLKTPYSDGTTHVIFEPLDFIAKLAALVPKPRVNQPRMNLTRFHGVFAPNSKCRVDVTPAKRGKGSKPHEVDDKSPQQRHKAMTWAQQQKDRLPGSLLPELCRKARKAVEEGGFNLNFGRLNRLRSDRGMIQAPVFYLDIHG